MPAPEIPSVPRVVASPPGNANHAAPATMPAGGPWATDGPGALEHPVSRPAGVEGYAPQPAAVPPLDNTAAMPESRGGQELREALASPASRTENLNRPDVETPRISTPPSDPARPAVAVGTTDPGAAVKQAPEMPVELQFQPVNDRKVRTVQAMFQPHLKEPVTYHTVVASTAGDAASRAFVRLDSQSALTETGAPIMQVGTEGQSAMNANLGFGQDSSGMERQMAALANAPVSMAAVEKNLSGKFIDQLQLNDTLIEQNIRRIAVQARSLGQGARSEIRMVLNPPQLGMMTMRLAVENGQLKGKIIVERAEAKVMLDASMGQLYRSLQAQGVEVHSIDVHVRDQQDSTSGRTSEFSQRDGRNREPSDERLSQQQEDDAADHWKQPRRRDGIRGETFEEVI